MQLIRKHVPQKKKTRIMSQDLVIQWSLFGIALLMIIGIVVVIVKHKRWGNFASLTVYHDLQTRDRQDAVEIVMEEKAGKKMEEQESGSQSTVNSEQ